MEIFAASDFFSVEVWTPPKLITYYVLFVISLVDRVVHVAGITTRPDEVWMLQVARNLLDEQDGALASKRYLILDRDTSTRSIPADLEWKRCRSHTTAANVANLNAYAERFVRSIKEECLEKLIFVGQASLRRAIDEFIKHYHDERNHQALANRLIRPQAERAAKDDPVHRRPRLGGMLNFYYRAAA